MRNVMALERVSRYPGPGGRNGDRADVRRCRGVWPNAVASQGIRFGVVSMHSGFRLELRRRRVQSRQKLGFAPAP